MQGSPPSQGESVTTADASAPSNALLSLRIWNGSDAAHQAVSIWETDAPAVCLALDLISASEGLPVARDGEVLVASFPTFQSAILAARRLQWAAQGFAEGAEPGSGPLAALIHAPKEDPGQSVGEAVHLLQQAAPEQILLSSQASRFFDNLPGFPLQAASGDGLRELVWRVPQEPGLPSLRRRSSCSIGGRASCAKPARAGTGAAGSGRRGFFRCGGRAKYWTLPS